MSRHVARLIGQSVLRPDDVVHDDAGPLRARITTKAFRGASILYSLELPCSTRLLAPGPSHHDHAIGEAIGLRWIHNT